MGNWDGVDPWAMPPGVAPEQPPDPPAPPAPDAPPAPEGATYGDGVAYVTVPVSGGVLAQLLAGWVGPYMITVQMTPTGGYEMALRKPEKAERKG